MLLNVPYRLLYLEDEQAIGGLREDFAVGALRQIGIALAYIKITRGKKLLDYVIEQNNQKLLVEVGGKSKDMRQFREQDQRLERFIFKDRPPYGVGRRPLSGLGLLI